MEAIRNLLRNTLRESLSGLTEADRIAAAWTVACGRAMAGHGEVVGYQAGVVRVLVSDSSWLEQMIALRPTLERDMGRISGVPVCAIHFELKRR